MAFENLRKAAVTGMLLVLCSGCSGYHTVADSGDTYWRTKGGSRIPQEQFQPQFTTITPKLLLTQAGQNRAKNVSGVPAELLVDHAPSEYVIGPWDQLRVGVWNHPEFSFSGNLLGAAATTGGEETYVVQEDGTFFFPYVGTVQAAGKSVAEIRAELARKLSVYVEQPQIGVKVTGFRSKRVYVGGEVEEPGVVPLTTVPVSLLDAVNGRGGMTEGADRSRVELVRKGRVYRLDLSRISVGDQSRIRLRDQDAIQVPDARRNQVFVLGEVGEQSAVPMVDGRLMLSEALVGSGGIDLATANARGVYVIRGLGQEQDQSVSREQDEENERVSASLAAGLEIPSEQARRAVREGEATEPMRPEIYHLDAGQAAAMVLANGFSLRPWDIVYVSSTELTRWNRVISQIMPTVQSIRAMQLLAD